MVAGARDGWGRVPVQPSALAGQLHRGAGRGQGALAGGAQGVRARCGLGGPAGGGKQGKESDCCTGQQDGAFHGAASQENNTVVALAPLKALGFALHSQHRLAVQFAAAQVLRAGAGDGARRP